MSSEADSSFGERAMKDLHQLEKEVWELREELEEERERRQEHDRRLEELEARTDMLSLVDSADDLDGRQRSVTLLQHLRRAADREADRGRQRSASITRDQAEEILHYPDLDRTTFYDDMRRCERLVDDESVCWYDSQPEARVTLNLEGSDVPAVLNRNGGVEDGC